MKVSDRLKLRTFGFAPKRMAYLLVVINVVLWPLHLVADWRGDEYLAMAALVLTLVALALGFAAARNDKNRMLPFDVSLIMLVVHWFSCKL